MAKKDSKAPEKKVVTLRHIADRVGVSRITVSMALREDGRISKATRERVREAAQALGYTPNPRIGELMAETARARHGGAGETLAFVTTESTRDGWKPSGEDDYKTVACRAAEHGYRLQPWWIADPSQAPARLNQILWARGVKGVIIPNISYQCLADWGGTLPIEWDRFCVVDVGGSLRRPLVNQVLHDHQAGLFMAIDELEALGYQRIGLCLKSVDDLRTHHRWSAAYFVWRVLRGYESDLQPLLVDELKPAAVRRWARQNRLDAIISPGIPPLDAWGFQVPLKLGFASLHLWGSGAEAASGIDQESDEIYLAAVDMLVTLLRRHQMGVPAYPVRWKLGGRWVAGATTRQRRPVPVRPVGIENELLTVPRI